MKYFEIEAWMGITGCSRTQALICAESFISGDYMQNSRSWDAAEWTNEESDAHIKDFIFDEDQEELMTVPIEEPEWDDWEDYEEDYEYE